MTAKIGRSSKGGKMHYSVGAIIKKGNKYLLIDRRQYPLGFAGIAGHVDEGETPGQALIREVKEESGLDVKNFKLIHEEEVEWNKCIHKVRGHYWYLFECDVKGKPKRYKKEEKSIGWYSKKDIEKLELEHVWQYWFKKLGII